MQFSAQWIGMVFGGLVAGWAIVQGFVLLARWQLAKARQQTSYRKRRAEFCQQIEASARRARASQAIPDWPDWRSFRVAAVVDEAAHVKSFYLSPVDGLPLAPFAPGQYLTFRLRPPGRDDPLVRCYSLSEHPREDYFRCTIKRMVAPSHLPGLPAGRGSSFFHDYVHVGHELEVRAPAGTFLIDPAATQPIALVGAGIGVTPLVSMLNAIVHAGRRRSVYVLFGFHNSREHPFKRHVEDLAADHPHVHLHVSYSSPLPEDVLYNDFNHRGRMTIERVREVLPSNNLVFYVCGPGPMMESLVPALFEWGVPESHVHYEAFGPASVKRLGAGRAARETAAPCEVRFERSGRGATWDGSHGSLLEFGESHGIALPSGCRAGSCGECLTAIASGKILPLKEPSISVPAGHCLTCISVPHGPLVLHA